LAGVQVRRFGILHGWSEAVTLPPAKALAAKGWALSAMPGGWALLVAERARGTVAAVDRHAVLQVTPVWGTRAGGIVATVAVACCVFAAAVIAVAIPLAALALATGWLWVSNLLLLVLAPSVIDLFSRLRFVRAGRAAPPAVPGDEVHLGASWAAWPAGQGYGTNLLNVFAEALDTGARDRAVVIDIYPREPLRDFYTDLGYQVINPGTYLMRRTWPGTS
jgi:hypothetical protein